MSKTKKILAILLAISLIFSFSLNCFIDVAVLSFTIFLLIK